MKSTEMFVGSSSGTGVVYNGFYTIELFGSNNRISKNLEDDQLAYLPSSMKKYICRYFGKIKFTSVRGDLQKAYLLRNIRLS